MRKSARKLPLLIKKWWKLLRGTPRGQDFFESTYPYSHQVSVVRVKTKNFFYIDLKDFQCK